MGGHWGELKHAGVSRRERCEMVDLGACEALQLKEVAVAVSLFSPQRGLQVVCWVQVRLWRMSPTGHITQSNLLSLPEPQCLHLNSSRQAGLPHPLPSEAHRCQRVSGTVKYCPSGSHDSLWMGSTL